MKEKSYLGLFAILVWLFGCQAGVNSAPAQPTATLVVVPQNSNTAVGQSPAQEVPDQSGQVGAFQSVDNPTIVPTSVVDPLRFVFPTQAPEPVSAWRPPLYPLPWEPTPYDHFYFARPISADEINWPLANYRYGGVFFKNVVHTGVDIPVKTGTPVIAAGPGRINWAGYGLYRGMHDPTDPYGLAVVIRHEFGYDGQTLYTVYGHLSRIDVTVGQPVETGDMLGLSGATGNVTGPHLHFEVRIGGNSFSRSRNPELWMAPPQGWGVLAGSLMDVTGLYLPREQVLIRSEDTGQKWTVISYGEGAANKDFYYNENVVIGDLPAGNYSIWLPKQTSDHLDLEILPGRVSFFSFQQGYGFNPNLPPTPGTDFIPPRITDFLTP